MNSSSTRHFTHVTGCVSVHKLMRKPSSRAFGAFTLAAMAALSVASAAASPLIFSNNESKGHCTKTLLGGNGNDVLDGSDSKCDETFIAGPGNDVLIGGRGKNVLAGGAGQDMMTGGTKNFGTVFVFGGQLTSVPAAPDLITDFVDSGPFRDYMALRFCVIISGGCTWIGTNAFSGKAGEVRYQLTTNSHGEPTTQLSADISGVGTAGFTVDLSGSHTLSTDDVLFK